MQNQLEVAASPDLQRQKRAIHLALCTVLTEEEADSAADVWAQNFGASASVFSGLNLFAREVCETYGKSGRQRELVQAMSRALLSKEAKSTAPAAPVALVEVNNVEMEELVAEPSSEQEVTTPEFATFQPLLLTLLDELAQHDAEQAGFCREFLLGVIDNLPWSPAQQEQVIKLINSGITVQTRPYRAGQLKTLMHHLTMWMKETLGNEIAARIVKNAIGEAAKTQAGTTYSPREFFAK
ncbi:MAG TPA: hypothetical protein VIE91_00510 [Methylophilaceae bacterium]|jgi:hypothetical protein